MIDRYFIENNWL